MASRKNDQFCDPSNPNHQQKQTTDLLFKNNRIRKHVTNFNTFRHLPCGRVKCMVPLHECTFYKLIKKIKGKYALF